MIFLCSLRHFFPIFSWLRSFFKKIYIQPSNRWFDLQVRRHSAECRGRIPTAEALSNGWSSIHHLQRIHGDIFRGGKHPQVMIIDSLLPNIIGSQSSAGTVDDDFPFPKGYVMVSWRVGKRSTLDIRHVVGSRESAGNDEFVGRPKPWYLEEHHQRSHPGIFFRVTIQDFHIQFLENR